MIRSDRFTFEMSLPEDLLITQQGKFGVITLNRPQSLNALNYGMIDGILRALIDYKNSPEVQGVLIRSNSQKAFCAGGDIRFAYEARNTNQLAIAEKMFETEYVLNDLMKHYPKPIVSLIDGIAMGGGMGISVHGSHRIMTEKTIFSMPETMIGFFPDIGSWWFFKDCPPGLALYYALTGARIQGADGITYGLGTHYVSSEHIPALEAKLVSPDFDMEALELLLTEYKGSPGESQITPHLKVIEQVFGAPESMEVITDLLESLGARGNGFARQTLEALLSRSPLSLKVTFHMFRYRTYDTFQELMQETYSMSQHFIATPGLAHDFFEGVRALLVDKDKTPFWKPGCLEEVSEETVLRVFNEKNDKKLRFFTDCS